MAAPPRDVIERLGKEYQGETYFEALRLVESLDLEARVQRSVVFLARGDLGELRVFAQRASIDWRDVVFWAEYTDHDSEHPRRVRSMSDPLEAA